jgi:hypothetical protein
MKRILAAAVAIVAGVAMALAAVSLVLFATLRIERMNSPLTRAVALAAALILGVFLLVGSIYLATRFAVWLLGGRAEPGR